MTLVVGYTQTDEGRAALRLAMSEATLRKSRLIVVHSHGETPDSVDAGVAQRIQDDLERLRHQLDAAGVNHDVRAMIRGNDPSEDIINAATEEKADFIIIGLRRRSPVGKLILGSNSQRTLLDAPCPVIAVHAPGT